MASNDVLIKLVADVSGLQKELSSVKKSLDDVGKTTNDATSKMTGAFTKVAGVVAGALAVDKLVGFGKECVELGADVEEMENKFNVVFGDMSKDVDKWAKDFTKAIGRNKNDIKGALANQVDLMMGFGMTGDSALKLAQNVTSLAIDLGSFNNVADDESILKLQKAIMGLESSGALESLGVDLTETTMATSKFTIATGKKWAELTRAEKMEVRYQEAVSQSARAVGDAERSIDSYTAQQKILDATVTNVKETIGAMLIPVMTTLTKAMNGVAEKGLVFVQVFKDAYDTTGSFSEALSVAFDAIGLSWANDLIGAVQDIIGKFKEMIQWFREHEEVTKALTVVVGGLLLAFAGFKIVTAISSGLTTMTTTMQGVNAGLMLMQARLQGASIGTVLLAAKTTIWTAVSTLATTVTSAFGVAIAFLTSPIGLVVVAIVGLIAVGYLLIKNWDTVKEFLLNCWETIKTVGSAVWEGLKALLTGIMSTISNAITTGWNTIKTVVSTVCNTVKTVISTVWNGIKAVVTNVVTGIKSAVQTGFNTIKSVVTSISNSIKSVVMGVWNGIGKGIQGVINGIIGCINGMVRAMNKISFDIPEWVPALGGKKFGFNIPEVPKVSWFATGGIIKGTDGGSVVGVGEAGDEAIVPLSNKGRMKPFAEAVAGFMPEGTGGGGNTSINVTVSQMVVREEADVHRISRELYKMIENRKRGMGNR